MGEERDLIVLRNPRGSRELLLMLLFLPLTVVNLSNTRLSGWVATFFGLILLGLIANTVLAQINRIVVRPSGVDLRTGLGRRHRLAWSQIDHFAARGTSMVDVHLVSGRRIAAMFFRPRADESPASMVALLEYQRRRLGGAAVAGGSAAPITR
ncbi:MAG TPA: PH domain-containing protein [Nakamurella multipartita]|jgi:hypothetical protein|nr:PH domain-containing protein [Nakamurella multipartita]